MNDLKLDADYKGKNCLPTCQLFRLGNCRLSDDPLRRDDGGYLRCGICILSEKVEIERVLFDDLLQAREDYHAVLDALLALKWGDSYKNKKEAALAVINRLKS